VPCAGCMSRPALHAWVRVQLKGAALRCWLCVKATCRTAAGAGHMQSSAQPILPVPRALRRLYE
jgi:hypothetical protein